MEDATNTQEHPSNTQETTQNVLEDTQNLMIFFYLFKYLTEIMFVKFTYNGANKYLIHCRFFTFSHKEWRDL